jgi:hypothetical protein
MASRRKHRSKRRRKAARSAGTGGLTRRDRAILEAQDAACPFGPSFFIVNLAPLVRDHCPVPEAGVPIVRLRLSDGDSLDLCRVVAISPQWVAVEAIDRAGDPPHVLREMVPYRMISRVSITASQGAREVGFNAAHMPAVVPSKPSPAKPGQGKPAAGLRGEAPSV